MRSVLIAKFDSAQLYSGNLYNSASNAQAYSTSDAIQSGITFLSGITTTTAATVVEANSAVADMVTGSGATGGQSFKLTTDTDSLLGTSANDIFNGVLQAAGATGTTAQPGDLISGGAGVDTFKLSVAGTLGAAYTLSALRTQDVEKFHVSNFDTSTNDNTIDLALTEG